MGFDGVLRLDSGTFGRLMSEPSTIFIVDDDEAVRDSLKLLLESHGCRVQDFGSTRDFLRAFRPAARQCLVLDHHLPDETGLAFLESSDGATLQLPVILVTGGGDHDLRERASRAGADAYFDKPLNDTVLVATILQLLEAAA